MGKAVETVGSAIGDVVGSVVGVVVGLAGDIVGELIPTPEVGLDASDQELRVASNPTRYAIFGETVTSGPIVKYDKRKEGKKEYHLFFTPLADHPCESVELYQLDGKRTTAATGNGYRLQYRLGDQTAAPTTAVAEMSNVDNTFVGFNITDVYHKYVIDSDVFPNGVQDVKFKVRGRKVYDPRKDDTAGGSGDHRDSDETTWEWSDNPALINLHWKRFGGAIDIPTSRFDMSNIAAEANICDELVTFTDKNGQSQTEKRYTCNGVVNLKTGQRSVENQLLSSCLGRWVRVGFKYYLAVGAYRGPSTLTITETDLKGTGSIKRRPYPPLEDRCNAVTGNIINANAFYQESPYTPVVSSYYRANRDGGRYLETPLDFPYTQSETMAQRLARSYLEFEAAADTITLELGWKGLLCNPLRVIVLDLPTYGMTGKEYEVIKRRYQRDTKTWYLELKETAAAIWDDTIVPAEKDLTPNTTIDNTTVSLPTDLSFTPTPNDSYRQGVVTWDHEISEAIRRYVVLLTNVPDNGWYKAFYPVTPSLDLNNLPTGNYQVVVSAENRFGKSSEGANLTFNLGLPSTPSTSLTVSKLPGRVVITGPELPNPRATYEWRVNFAEDFDTAEPYGRNITITVTPTPQDGTLYGWYRLVDGDLVDAVWVAFTVDNLIGLSSSEVTPELIASLTLPGLPQSLLNTISGVTNDIDNWSQQSGEQGQNYATLLYNVTEATGAAAANSLEILAVKELVGTTSVTAQITEFKNAQIGYEDPETGDWIEGAAFGQAFDEVRITDSENNELSIYQYFEALETRTGLLEGNVQLGVAVEGSFTGIEILAGESGLSSFRLFMDELVFASRAGEIAYEYLAAFGRHVWYGATCKIGATEMVIEDLEMPFGPDSLVYWRGPTTLNMGVPDFDNLTKGNANEWRAPDGEWYRKGKATLAAPELTIVDSAGNPLVEYDSVGDTIKNYGTFYAANIVGGLYGIIDKAVTQPADNTVGTTPHTFLTVTVDAQLTGNTFNRTLKSEPLRITWTSPNNLDSKAFLVEARIDGTQMASATRTASVPAGADQAVTFDMPALSIPIAGSTSTTTVVFTINSTDSVAGSVSITGSTDGEVIAVSIHKTDNSLS